MLTLVGLLGCLVGGTLDSLADVVCGVLWGVNVRRAFILLLEDGG